MIYYYVLWMMKFFKKTINNRAGTIELLNTNKGSQIKY